MSSPALLDEAVPSTDAPPATDAAPAPDAAEAAVARAGRVPRLLALPVRLLAVPARLLAPLLAPLRDLGPYLGYAGYFVGAGLISGGIVHYPLAPARYAALAAGGVVLFLLATLFNEVLLAAERLPRLRLLRVVGSSLLLSLGIGMLSGGVQHFSDLGDRAATLVPAGLVLSWVSFQVRTADRPRAALLRPATALVLVVAAALVPGLHALAPATAGHGHGHASPAGAAGPHDASAAHTDTAHTDPAQTDTAHTGATAPGAGVPAPAGPATSDELGAALAELQARLDSVVARTQPSG